MNSQSTGQGLQATACMSRWWMLMYTVSVLPLASQWNTAATRRLLLNDCAFTMLGNSQKLATRFQPLPAAHAPPQRRGLFPAVVSAAVGSCTVAEPHTLQAAREQLDKTYSRSSEHGLMLPRRRRKAGMSDCKPATEQRPLVRGIKQQKWTMFHAQLLRTLKQRPELLPQGSRVLVAVSGGQDSMALLRLLVDLNLQQHWPLQLAVAHCDHRMRDDSAANAAFVRQQAVQLGLQYHERTAQQQLHSEAAARDWRHQQLADVAQQCGCSHIVVGHTATDRAETLLFNMIRGAGSAGLSSMSWSRQLSNGLLLVRPLLGLAREHTARVCQLRATEIWEDSTNSDMRYARNRLRLAVFPLLAAINARAVQHMAQTSELLHADNALLHSLAGQELQQGLVQYSLLPASQARVQDATANSAVGNTGHTAPVVQQAAEPAAALPAQAGSGAVAAAAAAAPCAASAALGGLYPAASMAAFPAELQAMFQPSIWCSRPQSIRTGKALQLQVLRQAPEALRFRVVKGWLQLQLSTAVSYLMVGEVLGLLGQGQGHGSRTGSLWGSTCVMRHKQLLVMLDGAAAQQLRAGELLLELRQLQQDQERREQVQHHTLQQEQQHEQAQRPQVQAQQQQQHEQLLQQLMQEPLKAQACPGVKLDQEPGQQVQPVHDMQQEQPPPTRRRRLVRRRIRVRLPRQVAELGGAPVLRVVDCPAQL